MSLGVFQVLWRFSAEMCSSLKSGAFSGGSLLSLAFGAVLGGDFSSRAGLGAVFGGDLPLAWVLGWLTLPYAARCGVRPPSSHLGEGGRHSLPPKRVEFEGPAQR